MRDPSDDPHPNIIVNKERGGEMHFVARIKGERGKGEVRRGTQ